MANCVANCVLSNYQLIFFESHQNAYLPKTWLNADITLCYYSEISGKQFILKKKNIIYAIYSWQFLASEHLAI